MMIAKVVVPSLLYHLTFAPSSFCRQLSLKRTASSEEPFQTPNKALFSSWRRAAICDRNGYIRWTP